MDNLIIIDERNILNKNFKIYGDVDEPLFLAKDVAELIEHTNARMMLQNIDEDEKAVRIVYTPGGNQESWFVTEDGFYEVLMQSRKPIAKKFKKEVKKILKELRLNKFNPYSSMSKEVQAILVLDHKQQQLTKRIMNLDNELEYLVENMPLYVIECEELQGAVRKKGVEILGGYKTVAYNDKSLRGKVYADIHNQIKREFGLRSYKGIMRKDLDIAKQLINEYKAPRILNDEITCLNNQLAFNEVTNV